MNYLLFSATALQAIIGFAMSFTANELIVEARHGHAGDFAKGFGLAITLPFLATFAGGFILTMPLISSIFPEHVRLFGTAIGSALSATDPVFVSAVMVAMKNSVSHRSKKMGILLETESLFNDPLALYLFASAMHQGTGAVRQIIVASQIALVVFGITLLVKLRTGNRAWTQTTRVTSIAFAILYGASVDAATITLGVIAGALTGWIESDWHHEKHAVLDNAMFFIGLLVLVTGIVMAFVPVISAASSSFFTALQGGVFMILIRILTRSLFFGLRFDGWREYAIGGSGAVGVPAIIISEFLHEGEIEPAAFIAGCVIFSLIAFAIPTWNLFKKFGKDLVTS